MKSSLFSCDAQYCLTFWTIVYGFPKDEITILHFFISDFFYAKFSLTVRTLDHTFHLLSPSFIIINLRAPAYHLSFIYCLKTFGKNQPIISFLCTIKFPLKLVILLLELHLKLLCISQRIHYLTLIQVQYHLLFQ